jgi:glutaredoxin
MFVLNHQSLLSKTDIATSLHIPSEYEHMMRGNELSKLKVLDTNLNQSEPLKINVFTSKSCSFCNEAVDAACRAADTFRKFNLDIEVVETSVEEKPEIIEALNAIALPMIMIGNSRIIGLPSSKDIEQLLHQSLMVG